MTHTLRIYLRLLRVQFRSQLQYRASFVFLLFGTGLTASLEFASLALVLQRFDTIRGWTVAEVAFLYGLVEIAFGLMDMVFSGFDPQRFGLEVRKGTFDQILLRPISPTVQVLGSDLALRRIGRILTGAAIFAFAISRVSIAWTPVKLVLVPVMVVSMVLFFGGLFMIGATIAFWTVESIEVMNIVTYGGAYVISHPMHIYQRWLRGFFTYILPAIFLNYYPALFILGKTDPLGVPAWGPYAAPLVGVGVLLAALWFWRFGIRNYQSTGT
ncbi:MAG TPA: ABC-2 family transporter protein [Anaerolineales bacterium]|nr:ABC-2 family transporter protein [Anaerolineales bacterium]